jgi:ubiquitin carboxyl-terminal hydrolase 9/24
MSSLQITDNIVPTDCASDLTTTGTEENNQQRLEPDFPHAKLAMLDEKISSPRWVIPVLPEQELECLLQASIDLCKKGNESLPAFALPKAHRYIIDTYFFTFRN